MNFFTQRWCDGSLSKEDADSVPAAYRAYLDALLASMPATVRALADGVNIHDGLLQAIVFDRGRRSLSVLMRGGDLQVGYFDLEIVYYEVRLSADNTGVLRDIAHTPDVEALYDELDSSSTGGWVHRILFSNYREVEVGFDYLGLRLEPKPSREFD